jgi:hypothetical protein
MMRRYCYALLVALLLGPVAARADEAAQPVPADGVCAVPADQHWSRAEKFVWQRVCVGGTADFNKESGYGNDLDPRKPQGLPESRVLSSAFLETILLKDKYRRALTRRGVRNVGARFQESLDLEGAQLGHELRLERSLLEKGANLYGMGSTHEISLDGSKVAGTLDMETLRAERDLSMSEGAEFAAVSLINARVGGNLNLGGSKVTGKLDMDGARIAGNLFMRQKAEFAEVILRTAHIGGQLSMTNAKVTGDLDMGQIEIGKSLYMRQGAEFAKVDLVDAHVGSTFDMSAVTVTGLLDLEGLLVDADLSMSDKSSFAEIDLKGAGAFPESERAARETLALPIHPELTEPQAEYVVECIREFHAGYQTPVQTQVGTRASAEV